MSVKIYIKMFATILKKRLDVHLKNCWSPLTGGDHPEIDVTDINNADQISLFQILMVSAQCVITFGRFDIQYAINTLARFVQQPRQGHMKRALRLFGYFK